MIGHIRDKGGSQETKPNTVYFFDPTGEHPYPKWQGSPHNNVLDSLSASGGTSINGTTEPLKITNQNHVLIHLKERYGLASDYGSNSSGCNPYSYVLLGTTPGASDIAKLGGYYFGSISNETFDVDITEHKGKLIYMTLKSTVTKGYAGVKLTDAYMQKI